MGIDRDMDTSLDASAQVASTLVEDNKTSVDVAIDKTSDGFHSFYYSLRPTRAFWTGLLEQIAYDSSIISEASHFTSLTFKHYGHFVHFFSF